MDIDNLFKKEAFATIEPERLEAVKSLLQEAKGKSQSEVMIILMKYAKVLKSGKQITKEEKKEITTAITESLSEEEKEQFKGVLAVFGML